MSSDRSSSTKAPATDADHILVKKAYDAIVTMYNKKRPRVTPERDKFMKGRRLLDGAVSGAHEDIRALCQWVEEDFRGLPNLAVQLSVDFSFAVLTMFHELVKEHNIEVTTRVLVPPETHLHQETPEGAIQRISVAIGCLIDHVKNCSDDLPDQLFTKDWVKLFGGLLSTFALGAVPSLEVAEVAAELLCSISAHEDGKMVRLLLSDESFGPSFIGMVLASSQGSNLTVSMFQLVTQMAVQYPAGNERQALLRIIFPPDSWREDVRRSLVRMLHGKNTAKSRPDFSRSLVNCAADDDSLVRPRVFRLVGLSIDGNDLLEDDRNQRRVKEDLVLVYADLSQLVFKPFNPDGTEGSISFALKRVSNFASLGGGRFTYNTIPKSAGEDGVRVEFRTHEQDARAFDAFVRSCLEKSCDGPTLIIPGAPAINGEVKASQPEAHNENFDDDGCDDTDLLDALEAAEAASAPHPSPDRPAERETASLASVRPITPEQPTPAPKPKSTKSTEAKVASAASAPSRRSSRSAAATSTRKITAMVAAEASSQNTGPSQLDRTTEPFSPPGATKQPSPMTVATPPREILAGDGPDIHMAESSQVIPKHPTPPKGPYSYARRSPKRTVPPDPSPVNDATHDLDVSTAGSPVHLDLVSDGVSEQSSKSDPGEESRSKVAAVQLVKPKVDKLPTTTLKSDKQPRASKKKATVPPVPPPPPTTKPLVMKKSAVRGKRSKVDITARPRSHIDAADEDDTRAIEQPSNSPAPEVSAKRTRAVKAAGLASESTEVPRPRSTKSASRATHAEAPDIEAQDQLPSNSPLPWQTDGSAAVPVGSEKGPKRAKTEAKFGTNAAPKLSKRTKIESQNKAATTKNDSDADDPLRLLVTEPVHSTPSLVIRPSTSDASLLSLSLQASPLGLDDEDGMAIDVHDGSTLLNVGPELLDDATANITPTTSSTETPTVSEALTSRVERTVKATSREAEGAARPGKRKAKDVIDLTNDNLPQADAGPRQSSSSRVGHISLSPSSPLLLPTSSPAEAQAHSNPATPSFDSLDSTPDLTATVSPNARHGYSHHAAPSTPEVSSHKRKPERGEVDMFSDVSAVASAGVTSKENSTRTTSTSHRPTTVQASNLKPSLRSPPLLDHEERPSKRTRFDLPLAAGSAPAARTSTFATRKPARGSYKPVKENKTLNEVHSLFAEFYDPLVRSLTSKVEAPSRAMQKIRRQVELSAGATIREWMSNPSLDTLSASYEQRSTLFNDHLRGVFKRAKSESHKRHKRVSSICAEASKKPVYPTSYDSA